MKKIIKFVVTLFLTLILSFLSMFVTSPLSGTTLTTVFSGFIGTTRHITSAGGVPVPYMFNVSTCFGIEGHEICTLNYIAPIGNLILFILNTIFWLIISVGIVYFIPKLFKKTA